MKLFPKRQWSKWEHVMFVEDWRAGSTVYEIRVRQCDLTGLTQYKRIRVKSCVHRLAGSITEWRNKLLQNKQP